MAADGNGAMGRDLDRAGDTLQAAWSRPAWLDSLVHDLRGPIAPVTTALALLQSGRADARRQAELCTLVQRQIDILTQLLDDTGDLLSARPRAPSPQVLASALNMVRVRLRRRLEALEVSLDIVAPDETVQVQADQRDLVRLIGGLLQRCAEIAGSGGSLRVTTESGPAAPLLQLIIAPCAADTPQRLEHLVANLTAPVHVADAMLAATLLRCSARVEAVADGLRLQFALAA